MSRLIKRQQRSKKTREIKRIEARYEAKRAAMAVNPNTTIVRRTKDGTDIRTTAIIPKALKEKVLPKPKRPPLDGVKRYREQGPKKSRIERYAEALNRDLARSERWFQSLWDKHTFNDYYNHPMGKYIPDVINFQYRYIIEVDGSVHETPEQKVKDLKKDAYYKSKGYQVFRITYSVTDNESNILQYKTVLDAVLKIRNDYSE